VHLGHTRRADRHRRVKRGDEDDSRAEQDAREELVLAAAETGPDNADEPEEDDAGEGDEVRRDEDEGRIDPENSPRSEVGFPGAAMRSSTTAAANRPGEQDSGDPCCAAES